MDWLSEINEFPSFIMEESGLDLSEKEANQAVAKYEKALKNAKSDSLDIAIIELRKLVVLYPEMGQAELLLGCCQMSEGLPHDALKNFRKASLAHLPVAYAAKLDTYIRLAQKEIESQLTDPGYRLNRTKYPIRSTPEIISTSPNKWKRVKVASDREKREIMQGSSAPQKVKETFVDERMQVNWVKVGIISIAILVLLGIGTLLYVYVPKAIDNIRNSEAKTETKLEWLLARLNEKSEENALIEQILKEYDSRFYPTPAVSRESSSVSSSAVISVDPTPTPTTAPVENENIVLAAGAITEAEALGQSDPKKVMELISQVTAYLAGYDENATAEGLTMNAGEIMAKTELLLKNVVNPACYPYYRDGKIKMEEKAYQEAVDLFLQAYEINPAYLNGGNTYNLGKAYAAIGQTVNANKCFQYVVDNYPGTDVAGWAAARIKPTDAISE